MKTIDLGFRPNLVRHLESHLVPVVERWGMDRTGVPVSSPDDRKLSLWRGAFNTRQEAPVILTSVENGRRVNESGTLWFCGIALRDVVEMTPAGEQLDYLADTAVHKTPSANLAVLLLRDLIHVPEAF